MAACYILIILIQNFLLLSTASSNIEIDQEQKILEDFYRHTDGDRWKNNENWLKDEDICSWYGVICVSSEQPSIKSLYLSSNSLSGFIPTFIFDLPSLTEIDFSDNEAITSFDFERIENAKNLAYLNLDGTELTSLTGLEKAVSVKFFSCAACGLSGAIPEWFGNFLGLQHLNLNNNRLSGPIP